MKIRSVSAEIKKSKNFQTYGVGMSADLDDADDEGECVRLLQGKCRQAVIEQMGVDGHKP